MAKIISKRGQPTPPVLPEPSEEDLTIITTEIFIYGRDSQIPMSKEEIEHIERVFETIRKSLDEICGG